MLEDNHTIHHQKLPTSEQANEAALAELMELAGKERERCSICNKPLAIEGEFYCHKCDKLVPDITHRCAIKELFAAVTFEGEVRYHIDGSEACKPDITTEKLPEDTMEWATKMKETLKEIFTSAPLLEEIPGLPEADYDEDIDAVEALDKSDKLLELCISGYWHFYMLKDGKPGEFVPPFITCLKETECGACEWYEWCLGTDSKCMRASATLEYQGEHMIGKIAKKAGVMKPQGCTLPPNYDFDMLPSSYCDWVKESLEFCIQKIKELNEEYGLGGFDDVVSMGFDDAFGEGDP